MNTIIKKYRIAAGLTQEQLAERMGVTVASVQNWETGRTKINFDRFTELSECFNIPLEELAAEMARTVGKKRPDRWPDFLFNEETNDIIDTLHLNLAQQDLFGLLYIYDAEYLKTTAIEDVSFNDDLKRIPYDFISKVGSIQFMNQADGLHKVVRYVDADFLMKVLRLNPEMEFNIRKLPKDLICEFIDSGWRNADASFFDDDDNLRLDTWMERARIMLPVLEQNGPVHLTDERWGNPIRDDIPEEVLTAILEICGFDRQLFEEGRYKREYNTGYIRNGLETVTSFKPVSSKGAVKWMWDINEVGKQLLAWFRE